MDRKLVLLIGVPKDAMDSLDYDPNRHEVRVIDGGCADVLARLDEIAKASVVIGFPNLLIYRTLTMSEMTSAAVYGRLAEAVEKAESAPDDDCEKVRNSGDETDMVLRRIDHAARGWGMALNAPIPLNRAGKLVVFLSPLFPPDRKDDQSVAVRRFFSLLLGVPVMAQQGTPQVGGRLFSEYRYLSNFGDVGWASAPADIVHRENGRSYVSMCAPTIAGILEDKGGEAHGMYYTWQQPAKNAPVTLLFLPGPESLDDTLALLTPALLSVGIRPIVSADAGRHREHLKVVYEMPRAGRRPHTQSRPERAFPLLGDTGGMARLYREIAITTVEAGVRPDHVIIVGETGTGKELVAEVVHHASRRRPRRYKTMNCASLISHLAHSQLFGHAKDSFSGATREHVGLVEEANGGTVFLDEVHALDETVRTLLLRFLESGEFHRLGAEGSTMSANTRIVAATNAPGFLEDPKVLSSGFLARFVHVIHVPPLNAHSGDIPELVEHFLHEITDDLVRSLKGTQRARLKRDLEHVCSLDALKHDPLGLYVGWCSEWDWHDSNVRGLRREVRRWVQGRLAERMVNGRHKGVNVLRMALSEVSPSPGRGRKRKISDVDLIALMRKARDLGRPELLDEDEQGNKRYKSRKVLRKRLGEIRDPDLRREAISLYEELFFGGSRGRSSVTPPASGERRSHPRRRFPARYT